MLNILYCDWLCHVSIKGIIHINTCTNVCSIISIYLVVCVVNIIALAGTFVLFTAVAMFTLGSCSTGDLQGGPLL